MRARRRALDPATRALAARSIARIAVRTLLLRPGRRIAVYFAHGAELDLHDLIQAARRRGCVLYLPVITHHGAGRMEFRRYEADSPLRANRYGILEPDRGAATAVSRLDLVFAPLVAFDPAGSRLGSGAGFYDRALRRLRYERRWRRPRLIGVAYDCQRVERLERAPWDVPLDAVLTESGLHRIGTGAPSA